MWFNYLRDFGLRKSLDNLDSVRKTLAAVTLSIMLAGSTRHLLLPNLGGGLTARVANAVLVPAFGLMGAGIAVILSAVMRIGFMSFAVRSAWRARRNGDSLRAQSENLVIEEGQA